MAKLDPAAMASLTICESLILSLLDGGQLSESEADGLLDDARNAHLGAAIDPENSDSHRDAAAIIERVRSGTNGLRGIRSMRNHRNHDQDPG